MITPVRGPAPRSRSGSSSGPSPSWSWKAFACRPADRGPASTARARGTILVEFPGKGPGLHRGDSMKTSLIALVIAVVNPTSLAVLKAPGNWGTNGADIACGEGQALGVPLSSGGPYFGIMACKEKIVRQMPGRIVGRTSIAHLCASSMAPGQPPQRAAHRGLRLPARRRARGSCRPVLYSLVYTDRQGPASPPAHGRLAGDSSGDSPG